MKNRKPSHSFLLQRLVAALCSMGIAYAAPMPDRPPRPPERVLKTEMGITQLSDEQMKWLLDTKFGMFIHWGLYSGSSSSNRSAPQ